jgi:hypothetical protein
MIGFVLPVYKDLKNLEAVTKIMKIYPDSKIIVVADDAQCMNKAKELGAFVPYHSKKVGFGKSLCEGTCLAWFTFGCDMVVQADGDHPLESVDTFIKKLNDADVIVGKEVGSGAWKRSRVWSNKLIKRFILDDVTNPTCGFVVWKSDILKKIPWNKIISNWDVVHMELLFWAKKNGARITECEFEEVKKERVYRFTRYIRWAYEFSRLLWTKHFLG